MENPTFTAFEDYKEVPETGPLDFSKDDVMQAPLGRWELRQSS